MTTELTDDRLREIVAEHVRGHVGVEVSYCAGRSGPHFWPCETRQMAEELLRARKPLAKAQEANRHYAALTIGQEHSARFGLAAAAPTYLPTKEATDD